MPNPTALQALLSQMEERGILGIHMGGNLVRFVTHGDLSESDIDQTIEVLQN
jgi:threonine aldolase